MASTTTLPQEIEAARKRLKLSKVGYARRIGISMQALARILAGGGVNSDTLARLQDHGGVRVTSRLVSSFHDAA